MTLIQDIPVPVVAMVNGVATAAGCQLVASCDIAVVTEKSTFATPGVNVGLFCSTPAVAIGRAVPRKVRTEPSEGLQQKDTCLCELVFHFFMPQYEQKNHRMLKLSEEKDDNVCEN